MGDEVRLSEKLLLGDGSSDVLDESDDLGVKHLSELPMSFRFELLSKLDRIFFFLKKK